MNLICFCWGRFYRLAKCWIGIGQKDGYGINSGTDEFDCAMWRIIEIWEEKRSHSCIFFSVSCFISTMTNAMQICNEDQTLENSSPDISFFSLFRLTSYTCNFSQHETLFCYQKEEAVEKQKTMK